MYPNIGMHHIKTNKTHPEKVKWERHKNAAGCLRKNSSQQLITKRSCMATCFPSQNPLKSDELLERQGRTHKWPSLMDMLVLPDHKDSRKLCADTGCSLEDLPGEIYDWDKYWKRKSGVSVLSAWLDDDEVRVRVWFYGISTIVGHLMPNPFYTYM